MSKAAMKRGRSAELSNAADQLDSAWRNSGQKQNMFFESHICTIYRITLLPSENFSEPKALAFVDKHSRKRQAHCHGRLLEDRLTLERAKTSGRAPFRTWVGYREIVHVYRSTTKPVYFVLCVDSQKSLKKYYEIYKCKSPEATEQVVSRIKTAMANPDKLLYDSNVLRQVSVSYENRVRSLPQFDVEEIRPVSMVQVASPPPVIYQTPSPVRAPSPVIIMPQQAMYVQAPPVLRSPSPVVEYPTTVVNGVDDVTYIAYDTNRQPYAAERGPIYMFLSRRLVQESITVPEYSNQKIDYQSGNTVYASPVIYNGSY